MNLSSINSLRSIAVALDQLNVIIAKVAQMANPSQSKFSLKLNVGSAAAKVRHQLSERCEFEVAGMARD